MTTVGRGSRPVSESRQGENPREIGRRMRRERYGDLWFVVGVALDGLGEGGSAEARWKGAGCSTGMSGTEGEGGILARAGKYWGVLGERRHSRHMANTVGGQRCECGMQFEGS
jgi:hypothetical protein